MQDTKEIVKKMGIKIVALIGKSGTGKDTILKECSSQAPNYNYIISCTTRPPRQGETDGVNYHFISEEEFQKRVDEGDMLESVQFRDWHYGTSLMELDKDKINIGVFNPEGVRTLCLDDRLDVFPVCLEADDKIRLLRQLNREDNPDVKEIIRRFLADENDFSNLESIDNLYHLSNNGFVSVEYVADHLLELIIGHFY
jgi:guanylate kinase